MPLPLFACTDLVTASLCSSSFQTIQGAVCVLLEGPGISCWDVHSQLLLLGVGWGWQMDNTLANVKWKCYANGVGDKAPTHLRKGVGFRLKVKRSHFHSQPAADFSRLFPGLRCLRKSPRYGWSALPACCREGNPHMCLGMGDLSAQHLVAVSQGDPGPTCHHLLAFLPWPSGFRRHPPQLPLGEP